MSDLSTRVRLRREQLGLSQEELARRMGYRSRSSITKLEKGINDLPQSKVEELAPALEATPAAEKPVLRCSICTGEQVAGFQDLHTGHFTEVQLIRSPQELQAFRSRYGIPADCPIEKIY